MGYPVSAIFESININGLKCIAGPPQQTEYKSQLACIIVVAVQYTA